MRLQSGDDRDPQLARSGPYPVLAARAPTGKQSDARLLGPAPDPMMDAAVAALLQLGVPAERVHTERFDMA
jgi:ferredoxin-NADP reductase